MPASQIDLTTIAVVQDYLSIQAAPNAPTAGIQTLITSASRYWLNRTGLPTLKSVVPLNEWYDGNGNDRLAVRGHLIISISSLTINAVSIPQSTTPNQPGWAIDQSKKFVVIRGYGAAPCGAGSRGNYLAASFGNTSRGGAFAQGTQNINLQYLAGWIWPVVGEQQQITGTATIPLDQIPVGQAVWLWYSDQGVSYAKTGVALVAVQSNPSVGQYSVSSRGAYSFNMGDVGTDVLVSYTYSGPPEDVIGKVTKQVAVEYRRTGWLDQESRQVEGGSIKYRAWDVSPDIESVIQYYKRSATS